MFKPTVGAFGSTVIDVSAGVKPISRRIHGIADYVVVVILLSLPSALGLVEAPRAIAYTLAFAHLLLTALSSFPPGALPILPFKFHAYAEMAVGVFLAVSAWMLGFSDAAAARNSFVLIGLVLIALALFTNFDRRERAVPPAPGDRRRWYARKG